MTERFKWVPDVDRGDWLRPMEAEAFASTMSVVPRGFEAYARVFHPISRDRPKDGNTWQEYDAATSLQGMQDLLVHEPTTWAQAAASFGTIMHGQAQFSQLVRRKYYDLDELRAPDAWRYFEPEEGRLEVDSLAVLAAVLTRHTATPNSGIAAIWEGHGGLVSSAGVIHLTSAAGEELPDQSLNLAGAAVPDLADLFTCAPLPEDQGERSRMKFLPGIDSTEPAPGTGILSYEIATGPKFDLHENTGLSYFLFEVGATDLANLNWPSRAPWVDSDFMWPCSPSILWPDDHSWVVDTDIDYDSTLIAGSTALIQELMQTPGLEVLPIRPDADLSRTGDTLNHRITDGSH